MKPRTPGNLSIEEGQEIVRQFNCQGCHTIEGEGGAVQPMMTEWLMKSQDRDESEAQALTPSFSPPNLKGEGKKVQAPWLFEFLHSPETIRPWLSVRMPTYHFTTQELNTLVKYFNALDNEEFPFSETRDDTMSPDEYAAAEKLFSGEYFDCAKCHIVGDKLPGGSPESWAPNFALARRRLKSEWIIEWLRDPQDLLPGTKMPTFFDPQNFDASGPEDILGGDEEKQIKALRDYLLTLSNSPEAQKKTTPLAPSSEKIQPPEPADQSFQK
jgi:mono/diheme cytochrome c family protein